MAKKLYTAICFFPEEAAKRPHKYRNVSLPDRLCAYMQRKGARYINFYCASTQNFEFRKYLS
jgi:hypothetical protein